METPEKNGESLQVNEVATNTSDAQIIIDDVIIIHPSENKEEFNSKSKISKENETMPVAVKLEDEIKTAPFDPRFPNTNQTRYCYQSFLDFHRCQKVRGEAYSPCQYFKKVYTSICPNAWVEKWNDQIEEGTFPGHI